MEAVHLRSAVAGTPLLVKRNAPVPRLPATRVSVRAVAAPHRAWDKEGDNAEQKHQSTTSKAAASSLAASLLKRLEARASVAATNVVEKVLKGDLKPSLHTSFSAQRRVMSDWWSDHLALRASTTEALAAPEQQPEEEVDLALHHSPSIKLDAREAEHDRSRAAMREWYFPRSNPASYQ